MPTIRIPIWMRSVYVTILSPPFPQIGGQRSITLRRKGESALPIHRRESGVPSVFRKENLAAGPIHLARGCQIKKGSHKVLRTLWECLDRLPCNWQRHLYYNRFHHIDNPAGAGYNMSTRALPEDGRPKHELKRSNRLLGQS